MLNPSIIEPAKAREFTSAAEMIVARQALKKKFASLKPPAPEITRVDYGVEFGPKQPLLLKPVPQPSPQPITIVFPESKRIPVWRIRCMVEEFFGLQIGQLIKQQGSKRHLRNARIRGIAMVAAYLFYRREKRSLTFVASHFNADHTTLITHRRKLQPVLDCVEEMQLQTPEANIHMICSIASEGLSSWPGNYAKTVAHWQARRDAGSLAAASNADSKELPEARDPALIQFVEYDEQHGPPHIMPSGRSW